MEFITDYGLFLAKAVTFLVVFMILAGFIFSFAERNKKQPRGHLEITRLNDVYTDLTDQLNQAVLSGEQRKAYEKQRKKELKSKKSASKKSSQDAGDADRKVFVIDFKGDIRASAVTNLREEVTAVLSLAESRDEVVIKLESGGGMVHAYGLASSQLDRIKKKGVPLTVCVDKIAASGGYMMACVANKILAAPFAMIGSIGVLAQMPNFNKLLKKHDIDFEMLTAGEHKRTLTLFGENTDKGREKFQEEIEETHGLFKDFVQSHRTEVDIHKVATGEAWFGEQAIGLGLIDEICTSDEYLVKTAQEAELFEVKYIARKSLQEKVGLAAENSADGLLGRIIERLQDSRFFS